MDEPFLYEICVQGHLPDHWSEWFDCLSICRRQSDTVLTGLLNDQAALHGVLRKIYDLNLVLISVVRLAAEDLHS